jgi:protoheme IX farnesyltransferase
VNAVTLWLTLATFVGYAIVYTLLLKPRTPQNIVIGGAAGALPPIVGWAAATGDVAPAAVALFALIFFWTPPHFWALALYRAGDYARAGVPMLPVVAGPQATKRQMLAYTLVLWPCALAPYLLDVAGAVYAVSALALSAAFTGLAVKVLRDPTHRSAKQMFGFSILYLFLLFALMLIDRAPQGVPGLA